MATCRWLDTFTNTHKTNKFLLKVCNYRSNIHYNTLETRFCVQLSTTQVYNMSLHAVGLQFTETKRNSYVQ